MSLPSASVVGAEGAEGRRTPVGQSSIGGDGNVGAVPDGGTAGGVSSEGNKQVRFGGEIGQHEGDVGQQTVCLATGVKGPTGIASASAPNSAIKSEAMDPTPCPSTGGSPLGTSPGTKEQIVGMPTDEEIRGQLEMLIANSDLAMLTPRLLRESLEAKFGLSMKSKKGFIKETIRQVVQVKGEAAVDGEEIRGVQGSGQGADRGEGERDITGTQETAETRREADDDEIKVGRNEKNNKRRPCRFGDILSYEMAEFLGMERCPRQTVVKKLWAYIKENKLQDPKDGRKILFDEALAKVFGENGRRKSMTMLSMNKLLTKHVRVDDGGYDDGEEADEAVEVAKKRKKVDAEEGSEESPTRAKKAAKQKKPTAKEEDEASPPSANSKKGMMKKELELSEDLQKLVGAPRLTRAEVTKRFWQYIKERELLDPKDKRFVLSDALLEALTGKKRFKAFGFQKLFSRHMFEKDEVY